MCQTDLKVSSEKADLFLKKCYEIYSDFALKNPFYSLEMPIRAGTTNLFFLKTEVALA